MIRFLFALLALGAVAIILAALAVDASFASWRLGLVGANWSYK